MASGKSRKQKRRKRVKEKQRRYRQRNSPPALAQRALGGEIFDCRISEEWHDPQQLTEILVAREIGPGEQVVFAVFMVDQACLGLKDGFLRKGTRADYRWTVAQIDEVVPLTRCRPRLATKVLQVAREYAAELGFDPHPDALDALPLLDDVDPETCTEEVPVGGPEGMPFYVAGPDDNAPRIMARLRERVGEDGFHWMVPTEMLPAWA